MRQFRRNQVYLFLRRYQREHGYPPTTTEIGDALGIVRSYAYKLVMDLVEEGTVHRGPVTIRSFYVPGEPNVLIGG